MRQEQQKLHEDTAKRKHVETELEQYQQHLEELVEKRTAELSLINEELMQEIRERKRAEKALLKQTLLLNDVFTGIQEGIGILDTQETIIFCNPAFARTFEEETEHMIGKNFLSFFDDENRAKLLQQSEARKMGHISTYELLRITRRRKQQLLQTTLFPRFAEDETYSGAFGVVVDITARKQTEKALAEMALFAEMHPAPLLRTDLNGTILLANQAANELFKDQSLIGNSWYVLCPAVDRRDFEHLLHCKGTIQHEYRIAAKDFLFTYLSNIEYGLIHIYGADITQLKHLEAQLLQTQKMEAIGQLAGGIAHDFNTLLGIILGYGDMVREDLQEGSLLRDNLEEIIEAGYRAKALITQLMDFARPSESARHPVQLASIITDSLRLLRSSLPTRIKIQPCIESETRLVLANPTQITQVIMNLGINAADAIGEQEGELEISLGDAIVDVELADLHNVQPGPYLLLGIRDSGSGMNQEVLEHLFEPFFTTKEVGKGSGLGLSVVHGIVKSHKGFVTVENTPEKGSIFHVYLPIVE